MKQKLVKYSSYIDSEGNIKFIKKGNKICKAQEGTNTLNIKRLLKDGEWVGNDSIITRPNGSIISKNSLDNNINYYNSEYGDYYASPNSPMYGEAQNEWNNMLGTINSKKNKTNPQPSTNNTTYRRPHVGPKKPTSPDIIKKNQELQAKVMIETPSRLIANMFKK